MIALVCGSGDPQPALDRLSIWHGPVALAATRELRDVDFVILMPDGMDDPLLRRAKIAGVRIVEVVGERRTDRVYNRYADAQTPAEQRDAMADVLASFSDDPLGLVMFLFPWGEPGTALADEDGPDVWQREELEDIGAHLRQTPHEPFRSSTASGHGIGKSAETSWIILWGGLTYPDARGVVTANSDTQLRTKTWAELAKWWTMACDVHPILRELFHLTATAFYMKEREKTWRIDAIPNNPRNPAAFAGMHNAGKRVLVIVDEASEIEDPIWDTVEGALTDADTQILLLAYGNPTKNTGRFKENTIGKFRHLWRTRQIDSRKVKRTNKKLIQSWVDAWGEASDFVKVRVRGMFPSVGSMQLIGTELVEAARNREPAYIPPDPIIMGLDVARYGDDASVLVTRRGRDARSMPRKQWRGVDTMTLASDVARIANEVRPDALFVDIGGVGAGVYDRLVQLKVRNVYPVNFGAKGGSVGFNGVDVLTANLRASMWCLLREWLALGAIEDDPDVESDLTGVEYGFTAGGAVLLESKEHMKSRGLSSPDIGDAYALTFAHPVGPRRVASSAADISAVSQGYEPGQVVHHYDPYAELM